jgi:hypothetical protein
MFLFEKNCKKYTSYSKDENENSIETVIFKPVGKQKFEYERTSLQFYIESSSIIYFEMTVTSANVKNPISIFFKNKLSWFRVCSL